MSQAARSRDVRIAAAPVPRRYGRTRWWLVVLSIAAALPWLFHDYAHQRENGFMISMFSQMGMMSIFALSYNMLLGQAGLLSFCHAVFFGLAGYCGVHFLNAADRGEFPVPLELIPLLSGFCGFGFAVVFGLVASKQRGTAFAMITFGIGELVATAAVMFQHFFGGEGGVTTDRLNASSLFDVGYAHGIQVYYLILCWAFLSALGMYHLTGTPLGRMANACRDNHERAQFMGYDPRMVRFLQFALAGFFAGIGGGLYAIAYEIVTFDAVAAPLSANALLMAYIGGAMTFAGPILGAVLITALQSGASLLSNSWLVYVGVLFIAMVTFAPTGLTGILQAHAPILRAGRLQLLLVPYLRVLVSALLAVAGFVGLVEMLSFRTMGTAQGKTLVVFGFAPDIQASWPWLIPVACLLLGSLWLRREVRLFRQAWNHASTDLPRIGL